MVTRSSRAFVPERAASRFQTDRKKRVDSRHLHSVVTRKGDRQATPATSDVEHPHARFEHQLSGNVILLVALRFLK